MQSNIPMSSSSLEQIRASRSAALQKPITLPERPEISVQGRNVSVMRPPTARSDASSMQPKMSEDQMRNALKNQQNARVLQNANLLQQQQQPTAPQQQPAPPAMQYRPQIPNQLQAQTQMQTQPPLRSQQLGGLTTPQLQGVVPTKPAIPATIRNSINAATQAQQQALLPMKQVMQNKVVASGGEAQSGISGVLELVKTNAKLVAVILVLVAVMTHPAVTQTLAKYIPSMLDGEGMLTVSGNLIRSTIVAILAVASKHFIE